MPNVACLSDAEAAAIDAWVTAGGVLVATGETGFYDERGIKRDAPALACLPVAGMPSMRRDLRGAYFRIRDGELPLPETKVLMLDGPYHVAEPKPGAERLAEHAPAAALRPARALLPRLRRRRPRRDHRPARQGHRRLPALAPRRALLTATACPTPACS